MTVVVEYKGSKKQEEVKDVINFCRETCPLPKKTWYCGCRPMKHQNECQILKAYNKRSKKNDSTGIE